MVTKAATPHEQLLQKTLWLNAAFTPSSDVAISVTVLALRAPLRQMALHQALLSQCNIGPDAIPVGAIAPSAVIASPLKVRELVAVTKENIAPVLNCPQWRKAP